MGSGRKIWIFMDFLNGWIISSCFFSKLPLGRYDNRAATYAFLLGHGAPVLSLQLALQGHLRRKAAAMARMTNKWLTWKITIYLSKIYTLQKLYSMYQTFIWELFIQPLTKHLRHNSLSRDFFHRDCCIQLYPAAGEWLVPLVVAPAGFSWRYRIFRRVSSCGSPPHLVSAPSAEFSLAPKSRDSMAGRFPKLGLPLNPLKKMGLSIEKTNPATGADDIKTFPACFDKTHSSRRCVRWLWTFSVLGSGKHVGTLTPKFLFPTYKKINWSWHQKSPNSTNSCPKTPPINHPPSFSFIGQLTQRIHSISQAL